MLQVTISNSQSDTLVELSFDYREHFSGHKGKWNFSGQRLFKDSLMYYSDVYGSVFGDSTIYYFERKWFNQNGTLRRYVFVNFKKPKRAKLIDKTYSNSGELIEKSFMKAKRVPVQINPEKLDWTEKIK